MIELNQNKDMQRRMQNWHSINSKHIFAYRQNTYSVSIFIMRKPVQDNFEKDLDFKYF